MRLFKVNRQLQVYFHVKTTPLILVLKQSFLIVQSKEIQWW